MLDHLIAYVTTSREYIAAATKVAVREAFEGVKRASGKIKGYAGIIAIGREKGIKPRYELPVNSNGPIKSLEDLGGKKDEFTGDLEDGAYRFGDLSEKGFEVLSRRNRSVLLGRICPVTERSVSYEMHLPEDKKTGAVDNNFDGDTWFYLMRNKKPEVEFHPEKKEEGQPGWIPRVGGKKQAPKIRFNAESQTTTEQGKFKI